MQPISRRLKLCFAKSKMEMWKAIYVCACHVLVLSLYASITNWLWAKAAGLGKHLVCLSNIVLLVLGSVYNRQRWDYCTLCPELVQAVSLSLKTSSPCWHDTETDPKNPTSRIAGYCWLSALSGLTSIHTRWYRHGGACCCRGIRTVCEFWAEMETTLATLS